MFKLAAALTLALTGTAFAETQKAVVAGGCFWCVESDFEKVPGVKSVVSGYTGGELQNPTYRNHEGHREAVEITFDSNKISYDDVIAKFLRSVDVTDAGGQFCDRGFAYSTAIYTLNAKQAVVAKAAVAQAQADLGKKVVTPVIPASKFWIAEDYHQDYYKGTNIVLTRSGPKRQSAAYEFYRNACGRDARVQALWGSAAAFKH